MLTATPGSNRAAFLDMISHSEGTDRYGKVGGYDVIVGGQLFTSFADHPRVRVWLPKLAIWSTAAGRYQLLARYYDFYKEELGLDNFSAASQDAIALQQVKECGALEDVDAGRINVAMSKCKHIWASFPGAGYKQHENLAAPLLAFFVRKGGALA